MGGMAENYKGYSCSILAKAIQLHVAFAYPRGFEFVLSTILILNVTTCYAMVINFRILKSFFMTPGKQLQVKVIPLDAMGTLIESSHK